MPIATGGGLAVRAIAHGNKVIDTTAAFRRVSDLPQSWKPFDPVKLEKIANNLRKQGVEVIIGGPEAQKILKKRAEAAYVFRKDVPGKVVLRDNPSKSAVIEELIHLGQDRNSKWKLLNFMEDDVFISRMEIEANWKLYQISKRLKFPGFEIVQTVHRIRKETQLLQKLLRRPR